MFRRSVIFMLLVLSYGVLYPVHAERMYGSGVGRFLTPDPALNTVDPNKLLKISMRTDQGKMLSTSPYAYSFNNPLRYVDPDGRWPFWSHNRILTRAFEGLLNNRQIKILQSSSAYVDKDQSREGAYKHAMRSPGQSAKEAEQLMNEFLNVKLNEFVTKDGDEALFALGEALHPIMDSTSPSHRGFQEWEGVDSIPRILKAFWHFTHEPFIYGKKLEETEEKVRQYYIDAVKMKKEAEEQR